MSIIHKIAPLALGLLLSLSGAVLAQTAATQVAKPAPAPAKAASSKSSEIRADLKTQETLDSLHTIIRSYLIAHPEVIQEAMAALQQRQRLAQTQATSKALSDQRSAIYNDAEDQILGNPKGDVAVVEFFDFQCGFCKRVHPAIKALIAQDSNVKVILKQLPVLGPASMQAARYALAAAQQGRYAQFHEGLLQLQSLDDASLISLATELKLDVAKLRADAESPAIQRPIEKALKLAEILNIRGTPGFIIGNQIVPGAIDLDRMKSLVATARQAK
jgi:protein-disulfide isomerase